MQPDECMSTSNWAAPLIPAGSMIRMPTMTIREYQDFLSEPPSQFIISTGLTRTGTFKAIDRLLETTVNNNTRSPAASNNTTAGNHLDSLQSGRHSTRQKSGKDKLEVAIQVGSNEASPSWGQDGLRAILGEDSGTWRRGKEGFTAYETGRYEGCMMVIGLYYGDQSIERYGRLD